MMVSVCEILEHIVEKGEDAGYQHFLLFSHSFSPFYNNVFKSFPVQGHENPFPNKPWFLRVSSTSLMKTL